MFITYTRNPWQRNLNPMFRKRCSLKLALCTNFCWALSFSLTNTKLLCKISISKIYFVETQTFGWRKNFRIIQWNVVLLWTCQSVGYFVAKCFNFHFHSSSKIFTNQKIKVQTISSDHFFYPNSGRRLLKLT